MKQPRSYVLTLVSAAVFAVVAFVWFDHRRAAERKARADAETAGAARRVADVAVQVEPPPPEPGIPPPESAAGPVTSTTNVPNAERGNSVTADQLKRWLAAVNHPAMLEEFAAQARSMTLTRFSDLFPLLRLTGEQTEALIKLLSDKRQTAMDVAVADFKSGIDPRADLSAFRAQIAEVRAGIEKEIQAFLGDDRYAQYLGFARDREIEDTFIRIQRVIDTPNALTADQSTKLQRLLLSSGSGRVSETIISGAQSFLSPVQMQALQKAYQAQEGIVQDRLAGALPPPEPRR